MRTCLAVLVVALVVVAVPGADELKPAGKVKIEGETAYRPHALVSLKAVGIEPGASLRWRITPDGNVSRATTAADVFEIAAPPGEYVVEVATVAKGGRFDEARVVVRVGGYPLPYAGNKDKDVKDNVRKDSH